MLIPTKFFVFLSPNFQTLTFGWTSLFTFCIPQNGKMWLSSLPPNQPKLSWALLEKLILVMQFRFYLITMSFAVDTRKELKNQSRESLNFFCLVAATQRNNRNGLNDLSSAKLSERSSSKKKVDFMKIIDEM